MFSIVALMNACASKNVVVLLPDQDGKTGTIEVRNQGGLQTLDEPNTSTSIRSAKTAPASPKIMQSDQIKKIFGEAMEAMPPAPEHHILYFLSDSKQLTDESTQLYEQVLVSIERIQPAAVSVVGHTDRVGAREQNYRLGFERATEVKNLLIQSGVDGKIIETVSHGEDNPLVKTDDEVSEAINRRVEIVIR